MQLCNKLWCLALRLSFIVLNLMSSKTHFSILIIYNNKHLYQNYLKPYAFTKKKMFFQGTKFLDFLVFICVLALFNML